MSTAVAKREPAEIIEQVVAKGDLKELTPAQRTDYYRAVCDSIGLNPLTKPFEYITLNGKLTLYARKDATDQLRKIHGVSVQIVSREQIGDVYAVTAKATDINGRTDESIGAVSIGSLKGDAMCNALMKAETKAKRRVTLSICGLGMLDEAELETIPQTARYVSPQPSEAAQDLDAHLLEAELAEPEPVRPVKLEGAQPTEGEWDALSGLKGAAGYVVELAQKLMWSQDRIAKLVEDKFKTMIAPGKLKDYLEFATKDELRELYRIMNSRGIAKAKGGE